MEITVGKIDDEKTIIVKEAKKEEVPKKEIIIKKVPKQENKTTNIVIKQPVARHVVVKNKPKTVKKPVFRQTKPAITHKEIEEMLNVLKGNQKVIEDVVKLNSNMMERIIDLSTSVSVLTHNMNKFLTKKDFEEKPTDEAATEDLDKKLFTLEKRLDFLLSSISSAKQQ